jgi:uncharacterized protein (DUF1501 family)
MDRREFLRVATLAGLAVSLPSAVTRRARAQAGPYGGPFWVMVNAAGGWDPIYLCDPKADPALARIYTQIGQVGPFSYAPIPIDPAALGFDPAQTEAYAPWLMSNEAFFTKYASRLVVVNGVDTTTNNHDTGTRCTWSGRVQEGYPSLAALVAGVRAPAQPMAYLSSGGYDATFGVVPLTRIRDTASLRRITFPNRVDVARADGPQYHATSTMERITRYQRERMEALGVSERLPRIQRAVGALYFARTGDLGLDRLNLPAQLLTLPGGLGDLQQTLQQIQISLAAFKAGLAVAVNLNLGGFDTHGNHDRDQVRQLAKLLRAVDYLMEEAQGQGLAGSLNVVVGSDFGRGPGYNGTGQGSGKDHWPITSMMAMGPAFAGGRLIGGTDERYRAREVDGTSLQPSPSGGVRLQPSHVHRALRRAAGVDTAEVVRRFPLSGVDLPIFG